MRYIINHYTLKLKNLFIFTCVFLLAFNAFYFIYLYGVNIPRWDDLDNIPFIESFVKGGHFWQVEKFWTQGDHIYVFSSLITLANVFLSSWNVTYEMYFALSLVVISTYLLYLMLKDFDSRLTWLLIPISYFLFSPNQWENMLWAITTEDFFFCSSAIIGTIFFLRRIRHNKFSIIPSILFATIASFSNIDGLTIWVVGASTFYFQRQIKLFLIWLISAATVFLIYFVFHTSVHYTFNYLTSFLSNTDALSYIPLYVSNGLVIKSHPPQIFAGCIVLLFIIAGSIFLKLQKIKFEKLWPWVQLGLVGMLSAIITMMGRIDLVSPWDSRYTTLANPAEISALVIGSILFIRLIDSKKSKSIKTIFFITLVVTSILLAYTSAITYSGGWRLGAIYTNEEVFSGLHCLLKPDTDFRCGPAIYPDPNALHAYAEILLNLHLSPFSIPGYHIFLDDRFLKDNSWNDMKTIEGMGKIEYINANDTMQHEKIYVKKELGLIHATGWASLNDEVTVDSVYLFIDDHVNSRVDYGIPQNMTAVWLHQFAKTNRWISSIDLSDLNLGCHKVSVRIVHDNKYYESVSPSLLCIT